MPKRIEMPGFIKHQLATLKTNAPSGERWLHEIKYDGYRIQVHVNRGRKKVYTRNGLDWTKRFTEIAGALAIPGEAIIDGEVVSSMKAGLISPNCRQSWPQAGRVGSSITHSIFFGATVTFANSRRSNASNCFSIFLGRMMSSCP